MKVKMILPALTEAVSPFWRPIKYSLFPPLGLATLAAYCEGDDVTLQDEHVEVLDLTTAPTWSSSRFTSRRPAAPTQIADTYRARGVYVALGGLHVTALPDEAAAHADTDLSGAGRGHLAGLSRRPAPGPPPAALPVRASAPSWASRRSGAT